jgi:hypothetical protein
MFGLVIPLKILETCVVARGFAKINVVCPKTTDYTYQILHEQNVMAPMLGTLPFSKLSSTG